MTRAEDVARISRALEAAAVVLMRHADQKMVVNYKSAHHPVTAADLEADAVLREMLPGPGEGWLSEETVDNPSRLECQRIWVVDPLDGTREFVRRIPEWSISIALVEDGVAVAGGICNPIQGQTILGSTETGLTFNGEPVLPRPLRATAGAVVLASRSEYSRGEWQWVEDRGITVKPVGSVAYKLGLVAAGLADATWSLSPKNEWDIAAGAALLAAVSGTLTDGAGKTMRFNQKTTVRPQVWGFSAAAEAMLGDLRSLR